MHSININLAKVAQALGGSMVALILTVATTTSAGAADTATLYDNSCAACHDSGALGALKKGDSEAWQQLIKQKGMPTLIESVKGGLLQMPAGGLCESCSDDDYRQLINYMSK